MKLSTTTNKGYKIKLLICIEDNGDFTCRNELVVPSFYINIEEAKLHIKMDITSRLKNELYFRSQKIGFDLIRYNQCASYNTYLSYRIFPVSNKSKKQNQLQKNY